MDTVFSINDRICKSGDPEHRQDNRILVWRAIFSKKDFEAGLKEILLRAALSGI